MRKLLIGVMLIVTSIAHAQTGTVLDPNQVYTTGNLVQPTVSGSNITPWNNGVYQNSLTCWGGGDPGYCGPNAIVRPGNNINFSFGLTDLYQIQNISNALPNSGTGLRVNGYNFSFTAKNGNGWDDGRVDVLNAYVQLYDKKGNLIVNNNYDLNYKFDWTNFNYSETFTTPYTTSNLNTVRYGFVGKDNNYWAGPYGPEVTNVSFSLKYSVDPCSINVLSSPSCPGYLDALSKLTPKTITENITTVVENTTITSAPTISEKINNVVVIPFTAISTSTFISSTSSAISSTTMADTRNLNGTSIGLSVISKNQQREQSIAMQTAQNAIQNANEAATQTQQEALNVASQSVTNSLSMAQTPNKSTTNSVEFKPSTNNINLTFHNNQSSVSVSLFANPVTQSAQRQTDNNQNNVSTTTNVVQQNTRTNQTIQQDKVDTSNRLNILQSNASVVVSDEVESKPQIIINATKVAETNNTVVQNNQESNVQQVQSTYTLLSPQPTITTQQPVIQKNNIDTTQTTNNTPVAQEGLVTQTSMVYSLLPPQTPTATQVSTFQPIVLFSENKQLTITETGKTQEISNASYLTSYSLLPPQPTQQLTQPNNSTLNVQASIQIPLFSNQPSTTTVTESASSESQKMILDRSSPLFQTLENKTIESQNNTTIQSGPAVNRNAQNNEVAGGVDITRISQAPVGYNEYLNFTLRDAAFYAPKEVYANQKTVDNTRALRQLSSDRLHQEMVNQQYRK